MLTVRDLIDGKGKVQRAFVQITTEDQAAVAEAAGMDIIGTAHKPKNFHLPAAVPNTHFQFGLLFGAHASAEEAFRFTARPRTLRLPVPMPLRWRWSRIRSLQRSRKTHHY